MRLWSHLPFVLPDAPFRLRSEIDARPRIKIQLSHSDVASWIWNVGNGDAKVEAQFELGSTDMRNVGTAPNGSVRAFCVEIAPPVPRVVRSGSCLSWLEIYLPKNVPSVAAMVQTIPIPTHVGDENLIPTRIGERDSSSTHDDVASFRILLMRAANDSWGTSFFLAGE